MSDNSSALPAMTPELRARATARSVEERRYRAVEKRRIKAGRVTMADALADGRLSRMRVGELVRSMPGVGCAYAEAALLSLGIDPDRRLRGLGARQREALLSWADARAKGGE